MVKKNNAVKDSNFSTKVVINDKISEQKNNFDLNLYDHVSTKSIDKGSVKTKIIQNKKKNSTATKPKKGLKSKFAEYEAEMNYINTYDNRKPYGSIYQNMLQIGGLKEVKRKKHKRSNIAKSRESESTTPDTSYIIRKDTIEKQNDSK